MKDRDERKMIIIAIVVIVFASLVTFLAYELGHDVRWYIPVKCLEEQK